MTPESAENIQGNFVKKLRRRLNVLWGGFLV